jgi:hypothetical protein
MAEVLGCYPLNTQHRLDRRNELEREIMMKVLVGTIANIEEAKNTPLVMSYNAYSLDPSVRQKAGESNLLYEEEIRMLAEDPILNVRYSLVRNITPMYSSATKFITIVPKDVLHTLASDLVEKYSGNSSVMNMGYDNLIIIATHTEDDDLLRILRPGAYRFRNLAKKIMERSHDYQPSTEVCDDFVARTTSSEIALFGEAQLFGSDPERRINVLREYVFPTIHLKLKELDARFPFMWWHTVYTNKMQTTYSRRKRDFRRYILMKATLNETNDDNLRIIAINCIREEQILKAIIEKGLPTSSAYAKQKLEAKQKRDAYNRRILMAELERRKAVV